MSSEILDCCNLITWISPDTEILITGKFQQTRDESCSDVYTFSDYCSGRQPLQVRRKQMGYNKSDHFILV